MSAIDALIKLRGDLQVLTRAVKRETAKGIARHSIREEALRLGQSWFPVARIARKPPGMALQNLHLRFKSGRRLRFLS